MKYRLLITIQILILFFVGCRPSSGDLALDDELRRMLGAQKIAYSSFAPGPPATEPILSLGQALFFDKILSGNRDTSCATCHHPLMHTSDGLSLPIGVGGHGLGSAREMGFDRERVARNSPDIFNRGAPEWVTMFWDGRISGSPEMGFTNPAGEKLPEGLNNVLAVQAMFPVTSLDEMRGRPGETDTFGVSNELAEIPAESPDKIWKSLMVRLLAIPEYVQLFAEAYPTVPIGALGFEHAANAIAAYEAHTWTMADSAWDQYLLGDNSALSNAEKAGAIIFYGEGRCPSCHATILFTDQDYHNIGVPQLGPGKDETTAMDYGRWHISGLPEDRFAFRTPPLRNIALTGPWMHNGAYNDLEATIRHHLNVIDALRAYSPDHLSEDIRDTCKVDEATIQLILGTLDPLLQEPIALTDQDVQDLLSFLNALTSPSAIDLSGNIPDRVPSDLPVRD